MNIALFTDSYKPYISGVTVSVDTLAGELRKRGHRVFVFAPDYGQKETDPDVFRFPSVPTFYPGFRTAIPFSPKIFNRIRELAIDVVHSHSPFQLGLAGKLAAKKMNVPFIYTLHTFFGQYAHYVPLLPKFIATRIISRYIKDFCNSSDSVIVPSAPVKGSIIKEGVKTRIEVIPTGVDFDLVEKFTGRGIREKYGIPEDAVVLIYAGRLSKEKNVPFLLESFRMVLSKAPGTRLLIAARGPEEKALKTLAKDLGIEKRALFAGQIDYPNIFDCYLASDIFVFASKTETQGLVIAEALASGLPAVVVEAAGVRDAMVDKKTGYLVSENAAVFSRAVLDLINDPDKRNAMGKFAQVHARKLFSAEVYAERVEKIYNECYTKTSRGPQ